MYETTLFFIQVHGGAFDQAVESETPFGFGKGEGFDKGANECGWVVARERYKADEMFDSLDPVDGKITGDSRFFQLSLQYFSACKKNKLSIIVT